MRDKITRYIRAGYAGLYLVSHEEQRVEAELKAVATNLKHSLYAWSVTEGLIDTEKGTTRDCNEPLEVLALVNELPENSILLLRDFHQFLDEPNPVLLRKLKDVIREARTQCKTVAVLGCRLSLPPELERELVVVAFALPEREQLRVVVSGIIASHNETMTTAKRPLMSQPDENATIALLDAARGMTTTEAENAYALSIVETSGLDVAIVAREKAQAVRKNGLLELIETQESLSSIGGLDVLKEWLLKRREAFTPRAIEYGLPTPKGVLMLGIPGCGKSLTAKATAQVFGVPLLRLDAGRIFAGLVGQSEQNLRSVIQTAEAIAPCVLWLDELEKGLSGSKSSGSTDGGTSARVFGSLLSWMQEKKAPVFIVATANDVSQLPPELLRVGRWDQLFFIDLPTREERERIWHIQIAKYRRQPKEFDLHQLAKVTEGFTGSEIEQVFIESLYRSFDQEIEPTDLTIGEVLVEFVPLSKLMAEQLGALRNWAKGRARSATSQVVEKKGRKLVG
jgi:ATP-dependent 26S proteasome regulatory subunit